MCGGERDRVRHQQNKRSQRVNSGQLRAEGLRFIVQCSGRTEWSESTSGGGRNQSGKACLKLRIRALKEVSTVTR